MNKDHPKFLLPNDPNCEKMILTKYPQFDNYGAPSKTKYKHNFSRWFESRKIWLLDASKHCNISSSWPQVRSVLNWMKEVSNIQDIHGIDSRLLFKIIRVNKTNLDHIIRELPNHVVSIVHVVDPNNQSLVAQFLKAENVIRNHNGTRHNSDYNQICSPIFQGSRCNIQPLNNKIQREKFDNLLFCNGACDLIVCKTSSPVYTLESTANECIGNLPDVLERILNYCDFRTLSKVATVSRLWNELTEYELSKRGPQMITVASDSSVFDYLEIKPQVTLLFANSFTPQNYALKNYLEYFPTEPIVILRKIILMEETCIDNSLRMIHCIGLLIPDNRNIKIRTAYTENRFWGKFSLFGNKGDVFLNEFLPENSRAKATIFIFGTVKNAKFLERLNKRMEERQQKYVLWGGDMTASKLSELKSSGLPNYDSVFAMSITGSTFDSSAIVISYGTAQWCEIVEKLQDFRRQIKFKRHKIGLICGKKSLDLKYCLGTDRARYHRKYMPNFVTGAVKYIFPEVTVMSVYDNTNRCCYGSPAGDTDEKFQHDCSFSLLILTFD